MFSHGADSAHDAGGVGVSTGGSAVPTRFVWPYGGKRVYPHGLLYEVSLSDDAIQEGPQRISEAAIQISRCRVSDYLSGHTGHCLDVNLPVKQSFHILHEQGIPVAPLWDSFRGQFVGLLSPLDFILILRELETHCSNLTEEQLENTYYICDKPPFSSCHPA
ncbi:hypothetical protein GUJ93_ZPchr0003g16555 [Zizania palustris]|uniref:CBS domain-containing protein n=1 Tax=Zizania palustris TaxID=103762 RepID=A0A8J5VDF3_ZIZPA|nr:hypothetical protein GUJ93_ZPchr0003g16555 [Zizania palustris]